MSDEMLIEQLEMAHDREMSRYGYGCSPFDDLYDTYSTEELFPEDYMELD